MSGKSMIDRLVDIMLLAGLPLTIPVFYSYFSGEEYGPMLITVCILILPGLPKLSSWVFSEGMGRARKFLGNPVSFAWNFRSIFELSIEESRKKLEGLSSSEALALSAMSWVVIPMVTSLPYLLYGFGINDAIFEGMSGWTATGLSTIENPEILPSGFLLFRSFTQWIGGTGIILFALIVISAPGSEKLLFAEGRETIAVGIKNTVKAIWVVYLFFTLSEF
ncbi:MAG: potassium transporter TrkG [Candidatus Micrarchaeota archaeon]